MEPQVYEMDVVFRDGGVFAYGGTWDGSPLGCPNSIKNRLVANTPTRCTVDANGTVLKVVSNPVVEQSRVASENAEMRQANVANWLQYGANPELDVLWASAGKHFRGQDYELEAALRMYLRQYKHLSSVSDDYSFVLEIEPPDDRYRHDDDDATSWTILGSVSWGDPNVPTVRIWHFGPQTGGY